MTTCNTCKTNIVDGYNLMGVWYCTEECATDEKHGNKNLYEDLRQNGASEDAYWSTVEEDEDEDGEFEEDEDYEDDEY